MTSGNEKVLTASATAHGNQVQSDDSGVSVKVSDVGEGATTPEHLMASALAACFLQALRMAASARGAEHSDVSVRARVDLLSGDDVGYSTRFELVVSGLGPDGNGVVENARQICPFTKALDGRGLTITQE